MSTPTPHPHAAIATEWFKDTSRAVEVRANSSYAWKIDSEPKWYRQFEYRFAYEVKPENKIVSSLTDDELYTLFNEADEGNFYHHKCELREIANAAAQRAIEDLKVPCRKWLRENMPGANESVQNEYFISRIIYDYLKSAMTNSIY